MDQPRRKASWPFFVLGGLLMAGTVGIVPITLFFHGSSPFDLIGERMIRAEAPGRKVIHFNRPGRYMLFASPKVDRTQDRPVPFQQAAPLEFRCTLTRQRDGLEVEMGGPWYMHNDYFIERQTGAAPLEFAIDEAGDYILESESARAATVMIVRSPIGMTMWPLLRLVLLALALKAAAWVMIVLGIIRAVRNRRFDRIPVAMPVPPVILGPR